MASSKFGEKRKKKKKKVSPPTGTTAGITPDVIVAKTKTSLNVDDDSQQRHCEFKCFSNLNCARFLI